MHWCRLYNETATDPKLARIARELNVTFAEVVGWWSIILCLASASPKRGVLMLHTGEPMTIADIAEVFRCEMKRAESVIETLMKHKLLKKTGEKLCASNWKKRQPKPDLSTNRVRKHRAMKRETDENETRMKHETEKNTTRDETRNREIKHEMKRVSNGCETALELDSELEPDIDMSVSEFEVPGARDFDSKALEFFGKQKWDTPKLKAKVKRWMGSYGTDEVSTAIEIGLDSDNPIEAPSAWLLSVLERRKNERGGNGKAQGRQRTTQGSRRSDRAGKSEGYDPTSTADIQQYVDFCAESDSS